MRHIRQYRLKNVNLFKEQLLEWSQQYSRVAFLDSHQAVTRPEQKYDTYNMLAGIDSLQELAPLKNCFENLQQQITACPDWWFGFFSYDLKNEVEHLESNNRDGIQMPLLHFFRPRFVFFFKKSVLEIHFHRKFNTPEEIDSLFAKVSDLVPGKIIEPRINTIASCISKDEYIDRIEKLKDHIQRGDIYEINFCQEFFAENAGLDPFHTYRKLKKISPVPYSCFYRLGEKYLLSASPERFLKKSGRHLISQPIKGTARRGNTPEEDKLIKEQLVKSPKERAENIMVVDLVRNDLSRTAKPGTVKVEELCAIYTFPQVHQLISTVVSELKENLHFLEAIKQAFPMGSMTGVPKVRAMKLIEQFEPVKRGLYSGAVGYITPGGDFDFNVVIRSILYNATNKYLSFMVGGAITMLSEAQKEYEECILKAKAIMEVLNYKNGEKTKRNKNAPVSFKGNT